jgi:hypothetical protein
VALDCLWALSHRIQFIGYNPDSAFFTRIDDSPVTIEKRYRIANGLEPDAYNHQAYHPVRYFLSLHLNGAADTTAHGSCVLVYEKNGQTKCSTGGCTPGDASCPFNAPYESTLNFKLALDVINTIGGCSCCSSWVFGAFEQCDGGFLGQPPGGYVSPRDGILGRNDVGILEHSQAYAIVLVETEFLSNDQFALNVLKSAYYYTWCYVMGGAIADGLECFSDKDDPSGSGPGGRERMVLWPVTARGD